MLPAHEIDYLNERWACHSIQSEGGMTCVLLPDFPLPPGLNNARADLLLRISAGYPDVPPDMWWFDPPIRRADGAVVPATDVIETYLGRRWQRWSRHFNNGQWRSGVDNLESLLALLRRELERAATGAGS